MSSNHSRSSKISVDSLCPASEMVVLGHVLNNPDHHPIAIKQKHIELFNKYFEGFLFLNLTENLQPGFLDKQLEELEKMDVNTFLSHLFNHEKDQLSMLLDPPSYAQAELMDEDLRLLIQDPKRIKNELHKSLASLFLVHQRLPQGNRSKLVIDVDGIQSVLSTTRLTDRLNHPNVHFAVSKYLDPHVMMLHLLSKIVIVVGQSRFEKNGLVAITLHELTHVLFEQIRIPPSVVEMVKGVCQQTCRQYGALYNDYTMAEELLVDIVCNFYCDVFEINPESINPLQFDWQRDILNQLPDEELEVESVSQRMVRLLSASSRLTEGGV